MDRLTPIGDHMSKLKVQVRPTDTLAFAREQMLGASVRHLPVVEAGGLVGLVTMGDLFVMESVALADPESTEVRAAMARDLYCVSPETPLQEVAREMGLREVGSALVVDKEQLCGIFTATDACRVLGQLLAEPG